MLKVLLYSASLIVSVTNRIIVMKYKINEGNRIAVVSVLIAAISVLRNYL